VPTDPAAEITSVIGAVPFRMALAGGWIDQPFVSQHNPAPPGSMVVVSLVPNFRYMDRAGMASSTREVILKLWDSGFPDKDPQELMRTVYAAENQGRKEPSGSQDMAGLLIPGISRLDYDAAFEGGFFPVHIETHQDPRAARWLEDVVHLVPVAQRPAGYGPLGEKHLDKEWIRRLGQSGKQCYDAILTRDVEGLGASLNESMRCWEAILPHTVRHPAITIDLKALLTYYHARYSGAMYSGCGGGYLYVASEERVPGSIRMEVRLA
jgi:hypothetical protein